MAWMLRPAAAAARAVSSRAPPTQPMRHHVHGGRAPSAAQTKGDDRGILGQPHNHEVDVLLRKQIEKTAKHLAMMDMLRDSARSESLILDRQCFKSSVFIVAGTAVVGYSFGNSLGDYVMYFRGEGKDLTRREVAMKHQETRGV